MCQRLFFENDHFKKTDRSCPRDTVMLLFDTQVLGRVENRSTVPPNEAMENAHADGFLMRGAPVLMLLGIDSFIAMPPPPPLAVPRVTFGHNGVCLFDMLKTLPPAGHVQMVKDSQTPGRTSLARARTRLLYMCLFVCCLPYWTARHVHHPSML